MGFGTVLQEHNQHDSGKYHQCTVDVQGCRPADGADPLGHDGAEDNAGKSGSDGCDGQQRTGGVGEPFAEDDGAGRTGAEAQGNALESCCQIEHPDIGAIGIQQYANNHYNGAE